MRNSHIDHDDVFVRGADVYLFRYLVGFSRRVIDDEKRSICPSPFGFSAVVPAHRILAHRSRAETARAALADPCVFDLLLCTYARLLGSTSL